jgi:hypothetical protein
MSELSSCPEHICPGQTGQLDKLDKKVRFKMKHNQDNMLRRRGRNPSVFGTAGGAVRVCGVPTHYCGALFRSRLEASWARAFDAAGLHWSYEPVRFVYGNFSYLVDFYLRDLDAYAEVKPVEPEAAEVFKACRFHEWTRTPVYFLIGPPEDRHCKLISTRTSRLGSYTSINLCASPLLVTERKP